MLLCDILILVTMLMFLLAHTNLLSSCVRVCNNTWNGCVLSSQ